MKKLAWFLLIIWIVTGCQNVSGDWRAQYDLGMRYLEEGDYEQAVIAFTASIATDPRRPEVYAARGDAYMLGAQPEDYISLAIADYEAALGLDEGFVQVYLKLADVYIGQGDYEKALELLREGLEKTGQNEEIAEKLSGLQQDTGTSENTEAETEEETETAVSGFREARVESYQVAEDGTETLMYVHENSYDEAGRRIRCEAEVKEESETGVTGWFDVYSYDEVGNHIRTDYNNFGFGTFEGYFENEFDGSGNCIHENLYYDWDNRARLYQTTENHYDETGKLIYQDASYYDLNSPGDGALEGTSHDEYIYNDLGQLVRQECIFFGDSWRYEYVYDESGRCIQKNYYGAEGMTSSMEYEYDENGNRVREKEYHYYNDDKVLFWHKEYIWEEGPFIDSKTTTNYFGEYDYRGGAG